MIYIHEFIYSTIIDVFLDSQLQVALLALFCEMLYRYVSFFIPVIDHIGEVIYIESLIRQIADTT